MYTQKQWDALKLTAKEWSGLDRCGFVYSEVAREKGTRNEQSFFHRKCTESMQTQSKLLQAKSRKKKIGIGFIGLYITTIKFKY